MPRLLPEPTCIPGPGGKVFDEHVGRVGAGTEAIPVSHRRAPANWGELFQRPAFDQITLVLAGSVTADHRDGPTAAHAGQAILTSAGGRVRYSCGPDGAEFVAVGLPAFAPDTVNRED